MKEMKHLSGIALIAIAMLLASTPANVFAMKLIRFATLAPEGSTWMVSMRQIDDEVRAATGGEVGFKFYPNMSMGDEKDVVRKIRLGQINGGGFTGFGLGEILPEIRILELPYLFETEAEIDCTFSLMEEHFRQGFESKGFIFLGWADVGWIYFMAQKPVASPADLGGAKVWMWEGDPLARTFYSELGKTPISLSVTDVMMSLQTGMVDAVYGSPLSTLVLQWFTRLKYISDIPFTNAVGAVLMDKATFDGLKPEHQQAVRDISKKRLRELVLKSRADNRNAYQQLVKEGLQVVVSTPSQRAEMRAIGLRVEGKLIGELYSSELLAKLKKAVTDARKK